MSKRNIHIVPKGNHWETRRAGAGSPMSRHRTQSAADRAVRPQARRDHVELVIHGRDGRIRDKDSFGNDPCPPRDKRH